MAAYATTGSYLGFFEDGPDDVAESFVEHLNEGEFEEVEDTIELDMRTEDGDWRVWLLG